MAKVIIWTPEAENTFETIIEFLNRNWTENEIEKFINATD